MKNIYTKTLFSLLLSLPLWIPAAVKGQCTCSGGVPAQSIRQSLTIAPTTVSSLSFNFQQFDPSVGTLSCVAFTDTVTGISYTGARNTGPDSTAFLFNLSLTAKIAGPGILISHPFTQIYGYDTLAPYGIPGDSITYGPANIITNPTGSASTGGNAGYLGTGTVPVVYTINGGMITQDGGSNYKSSVTTTIGGTMTLTYYYCPLAVLASSLQNFTAFRQNQNILLKWDAQNAETIDQFQIEISTNGVDFAPVGQVAGRHTADGNYTFNYPLNGNNGGTVYFRIKQTGASSRSSYSGIQKISLDGKGSTGIAIHPNPAVTGITLTFEEALNGDYSVDIVNTAGQVVLNKRIHMAGNNTIPINFSNKPAPGIYFTRVTNTGTMQQQLTRLLIK